MFNTDTLVYKATLRTLSTSQYYKHSLVGDGIILTVTWSPSHIAILSNMSNKAKGYPDISSRQFLYHLSIISILPIFALVDFDPDGLGIMSTYKYGSVSLAHENSKLAVPRIRWLGLKSSDIFQRTVDQNGAALKDKVGLIKLSSRDRRIATRMLKRECFEEKGREEEWRRELQVMLMLNVKAEIQMLNGGMGGLEAWLNEKLREALV
jgi:meiotic recombination protein SPO11